MEFPSLIYGGFSHLRDATVGVACVCVLVFLRCAVRGWTILEKERFAVGIRRISDMVKLSGIFVRDGSSTMEKVLLQRIQWCLDRKVGADLRWVPPRILKRRNDIQRERSGIATLKSDLRLGLYEFALAKVDLKLRDSYSSSYLGNCSGRILEKEDSVSLGRMNEKTAKQGWMRLWRSVLIYSLYIWYDSLTDSYGSVFLRIDWLTSWVLSLWLWSVLFHLFPVDLVDLIYLYHWLEVKNFGLFWLGWHNLKYWKSILVCWMDLKITCWPKITLIMELMDGIILIWRQVGMHLDDWSLRCLFPIVDMTTDHLPSMKWRYKRNRIQYLVMMMCFL